MSIIREFLAGNVQFVHLSSNSSVSDQDKVTLTDESNESRPLVAGGSTPAHNRTIIVSKKGNGYHYQYTPESNQEKPILGYLNEEESPDIEALILKDIIAKEKKSEKALAQTAHAAGDEEEKSKEQEKVSAEKKFFEILILLAKLRANELSLYDFENQLNNFFDLLSPEELGQLVEYKREFDKMYGRGNAIAGKWTDYTMTFFYVAFCFTGVVAVALGMPGVIPNDRLTFGFGNSMAEIGSAASWNFVDSAMGLAQSFKQVYREAPALASMNMLSSSGMIACSVAGICEVVKGNVQFAADLTGWSFTFAMFACAAVEVGGYLRCKKNVSIYQEELTQYCEINCNTNINAELKKIETLLEKDKWGQRTVELVHMSANILIAAKKAEMLPEVIVGLEQRLNTLILERAETNNHFWMATAWTACGVGMAFLSGAMTWAGIQTGGGSLLFTSIVSPIVNTTMAMVSAFFRTRVMLAWDDVAKAKKAIQERNDLLSDLRSPRNNVSDQLKYELKEGVATTSNLEPGEVWYKTEGQTVHYTVQRFDGKTRSGNIPLSKVTQKGSNKIDSSMLLDQIAKKGDIIRGIDDIKGKVSILQNVYDGLSSASGLFGGAHKEAIVSPRKSEDNGDRKPLLDNNAV